MCWLITRWLRFIWSGCYLRFIWSGCYLKAIKAHVIYHARYSCFIDTKATIRLPPIAVIYQLILTVNKQMQGKPYERMYNVSPGPRNQVCCKVKISLFHQSVGAITRQKFVRMRVDPYRVRSSFKFWIAEKGYIAPGITYVTHPPTATITAWDETVTYELCTCLLFVYRPGAKYSVTDAIRCVMVVVVDGW